MDEYGGAGYGDGMDLETKRRIMVLHNLTGYVNSGEVHVIRHLTSDKGRALNGRTCRIVGHNGTRLEVVLLEGGRAAGGSPGTQPAGPSAAAAGPAPKAPAPKGFLLLPKNLLPARSAFAPPPGPPLDDDVVVRELQAALAHPSVADMLDVRTSMRDDTRGRAAFVAPHLAAGHVPPPSRCMDPMCELRPGTMVEMLEQLKPCCHGDGTVDFHRFASGTVGSGVECALCMEAVTGEAPALGMPCGHVFHSDCAGTWLAEHDTCPTCRFRLGGPGAEYTAMLADRDERVRIRMREWFISGMCDRCMAAYHEADPMLAIKDPTDPSAPGLLIPRSQLREYEERRGMPLGDFNFE